MEKTIQNIDIVKINPVTFGKLYDKSKLENSGPPINNGNHPRAKIKIAETAHDI
jgi:hypothetical protein